MAGRSPFDAETQRLLEAVKRMRIRRPVDVLKIVADALPQVAGALKVKGITEKRRRKLLKCRRQLRLIQHTIEVYLTAKRTS